MEQLLTNEQIEECRQKFNLSYHVNQSVLCQQHVGFTDKEVLEVGGSLPSGFVFDYLRAKSWTAVETPDYGTALSDTGGITHTGTVIGTETVRKRKFTDTEELQKYNFFYDDICNLPESLYNRFDLVFSLAAFEHIHKLPAALTKMYHALKPGGRLFSLFSPIWPCWNGHHLPDITDRSGRFYNFENSPVPNWGHLLMSASEMFNYLCGKTDRPTAEEMVYYIYNAPNINRFFVEDYYNFVTVAGFTMEIFNGIVLLDHFPDDVKAQLVSRYPGRAYFNMGGLIMVLKK